MKQTSAIPLLKFENNALPFKVQTMRSLIEQSAANEFPHSHDYYEMVWIINGKGRLSVDLQQYIIGSNMIFCLKPDQTHQFQFDAQVEGFIFSFTDPFFTTDEHEFDWTCQSGLFKFFSQCQVIGIRHQMGSDMKEVVLNMMKESDNLYPFRMQLLKRYFRIFLIYLIRQLDEDSRTAWHTREVELVKKFMEMLDKNFIKKKAVAEYAAHLYVTPNYLNQIVKKNTGFPASHHIKQRIVLEAKRMGRYSDAGMKEIAYNLGFLDSAHFSKFFKTVCGKNFSEFKKEGLNFLLVDSHDKYKEHGRSK